MTQLCLGFNLAHLIDKSKYCFSVLTILTNQFLRFNRRMPNCTTVVQTASDLELIETKFPRLVWQNS